MRAAAWPEEKFLTREETRRILRVSSSKLDAETRAGRLKVHRFGRLVRISASDLAEYLKNSRDRARGNGLAGAGLMRPALVEFPMPIADAAKVSKGIQPQDVQEND